ncbi:MAG TPA: FAD-binding oxidoreductase [Panacibacter sp.]|nr:FAD-binding oxidoreductase [Panacibacter sp.]HNP46458.1 FAD-binding oxidoreductase [Panacibacter sp.]
MDLHSGLPFWLIKSGLPFNYYPLDRSLTTDVAIIGGGISGALAAYYLTSAGISCIVLDARTIGLGSTCASTALLQYEIDVPLCRLKEKTGIKKAARAYHLCRQAIEKLGAIAGTIKCTDYQPKHSLYFAAHKKDEGFLKEEYNIRKQQGFNVDFLSPSQLKLDYGFTAPAGILSHHGSQLNAYMYTHELLQYSIKKGLLVFDRTEVTHARHKQKSVELTVANGCKIKALKLVYASGYETVKYIDKKIVALHSTYAVISENMSQQKPFWKDDALLWNTANPYLYMRTTIDNRIICGGRDEAFFNPTKRDALIGKKTRLLVKDFSGLFPGIAFKPEFSWTGVFGSTTDGLPFIGPYKKLPNSFFALGFGGNGITFSQVAAEILLDHVKGKKNRDAALFSFERL